MQKTNKYLNNINNIEDLTIKSNRVIQEEATDIQSVASSCWLGLVDASKKELVIN